MVSESASKQSLQNAKAIFGAKHVTILKSLEQASKEKILATPGLDNLLESLKLKQTEFEMISNKAAFKKAVIAAKAFATAKTFEAKIKALKSIKYTETKPAGYVEPAYKHTPSKQMDSGSPVAPTSSKTTVDQALAKQLTKLVDADAWTIFSALGKHVKKIGPIPTQKQITQISRTVFDVFDKRKIEKLYEDYRKLSSAMQVRLFAAIKEYENAGNIWENGGDDGINDLVGTIISEGKAAYDEVLSDLKNKGKSMQRITKLNKKPYWESFSYLLIE